MADASANPNPHMYHAKENDMQELHDTLSDFVYNQRIARRHGHNLMREIVALLARNPVNEQPKAFAQLHADWYRGQDLGAPTWVQLRQAVLQGYAYANHNLLLDYGVVSDCEDAMEEARRMCNCPVEALLLTLAADFRRNLEMHDAEARND